MFSKGKKMMSFVEKASQPPPPTYSESAAMPSLPTPAFRTRFASLSMHMHDRLRFLHFPPEVVQACQQTITRAWRKGIQQTRPYGGSHEVKLHGFPWCDTSPHQAIESRRLVCALLGTLYSFGWVMTLGTDISKKDTDKDVLLFRYQNPLPAECEWASIEFSGHDIIRFIDFPSEIRDTVAARFRPRTVQGTSTSGPEVHEIKCRGYPWYASGEDTIKVREMVLILMEVLEEEGWTVYASIDQQSNGGDLSETDTWHLCKPKGWIKGAPVYHS